MRGRKPKSGGKVKKVMHEFKTGALRSGSKAGPKVKNRRQAVAIALNEARRAGESVPSSKTASRRKRARSRSA